MRTGRPVFHIKARWISIDTADGSVFYRLDERGKLILVNGLVTPHHTVTASARSSDQEITSKDECGDESGWVHVASDKNNVGTKKQVAAMIDESWPVDETMDDMLLGFDSEEWGLFVDDAMGDAMS